MSFQPRVSATSDDMGTTQCIEARILCCMQGFEGPNGPRCLLACLRGFGFSVPRPAGDVLVDDWGREDNHTRPHMTSQRSRLPNASSRGDSPSSYPDNRTLRSGITIGGRSGPIIWLRESQLAMDEVISPWRLLSWVDRCHHF